MRRLMLAGLLCLSGLVVEAPARAEIWCLRGFDSDPAKPIVDPVAELIK